MKLTLNEIAKLINAKLIGDSSKKVSCINSLHDASAEQISYAVSLKFKEPLIHSKAGAIIVNKNLKQFCSTNVLVVENVYLAYSILTHKFKYNQDVSHFQYGDEVLKNYNKVFIGRGTVLGNNVSIGEGSIIGANCVIEDNVSIGENSRLESNISIHIGTKIGKNCSISSGAVIGSEGFGHAKDNNNQWHSIAHLGNVVIGENVSIGANTSIDRGNISNTEVHDGVKIDNLVHIAHNVVIGQDTAIAAKTGIAGSTVIGKRCMIGGMVGIVGHLTITDDVIINATSTVNRNVKKTGVYTSFVPLMPHSEWKKVGVWLTKLDKITALLKIKLKDIN